MASSTPSHVQKRLRSRPRDSLEDEDDQTLDAMLVELGIPRGNRAPRSRDPSVPSEVIELLTPSPPAKKSKTQNDGPISDVIVDLTTSPSSPTPAPSNGYINADQTVEVAVDEHDVSFSYDPCESPPPFVYTLPPQAQAAACEDDEEPEVLSPEMTTSARRQVFPDERKRAGATQARRLSGRLKDLHSEAKRGCDDATKRRKQPEATSGSAMVEVARASTTGSPARSRTGASPTRSRIASTGASASGRGTGAAAGVLAVVQMEKSLDTSAAGDAIRTALKNHVYNGKPVPFTVATALNCIMPGVIRWERKGNSASHYSCAIYYEADVFLPMIQKKSYQELVAVVRYLQTLVPKSKQSGRKNSCQPKEDEELSKFFVIIEGMDRALIKLNKQQKKKKKHGPASSPSSAVISFADLQEVAFQLFMDIGAHTKFTCDLEATADYVALLTRELVVASSRATALEEFLESVPRYNSFRVTHSGGTTSACANAWLRMLQVIPGVSEDKAQCLLTHFPTVNSLMRAYHDPSLSRAQKEDLVADKLHDVRIQRALSKRIYLVFCEEDPDAMV